MIKRETFEEAHIKELRNPRLTIVALILHIGNHY